MLNGQSVNTDDSGVSPPVPLQHRPEIIVYPNSVNIQIEPYNLLIL